MQRAAPAAIALLVTASVLITRQSGQPATQLRCRPSAEIWIIRHGEKAANASRTLDLDLSPAGVDRAKNLERLVTSGDWPRFAAVYATSPSAPPFVRREYETVAPLAQALGVQINVSFGAFETEALAADAMRTARSLAAADDCRSPAVLIAWEHCRIPKLRRALGCDTGRCRACWSDLDYDSVDRFRVFAADGGVDVLPPTSEGFGGGEATDFLYAMCVDKESEEPGLDCVPPY